MATTSALTYMQVGDTGTLTFNVGMRADLYVTKGKPYPMTITAAGYELTIIYTNDVGVLTTTTYDRGDEHDGYESVRVILDDDVFDARVEELYTKNVAVRVAKHEEEMQSCRAYYDKVKAAARK